MIDALYQRLAIPESCCLGKRVYKKLFFENAQLGVTDKKAFEQDIDSVTWQYALKPNTIQIASYEDEEREYHEIAVLQVNLRENRRYRRIAEVIHRAIPYPLLLIFVHEDTFAVSLAHKRFSQAEREKIVVDEFFFTDWINPNVSANGEAAFLGSLDFGRLPQTNCFSLYSGLVDRVIALDCARLTGQFRLESAAAQQYRRRKLLQSCHQLERQIAELRAQIKAETQFNRQVELNVRIKALESQLKKEVAML